MPHRLGIVGLTFIVVLVPFGAYYLYYVSSQKAYFTSRDFRVLERITDQVQRRIDTVKRNVTNSAEKALEQWCELDDCSSLRKQLSKEPVSVQEIKILRN